MILGVYDVIYVMTSRMTSQLRYYPIWRQNTKYGGRSLRLSCNDHLVTDVVTGRMYLTKGEHLMRIAETASHRPFQDHELSMSRHIPEREYFGQGGQEPPLGPRPKIAREGRGDLDPPTPAVGVVGEIGRTPIPVAESTRHPGEKLLPSVREHEGEEPDQTGGTVTPAQSQGGAVGEPRDDHEGREPEWALPRPSDPRGPPKVETAAEEATSRGTQRQDGGSAEQRYPTPRQ